MSLTETLAVLASVATAVERLTIFAKPFFLKTKIFLFRKNFTECTKIEKIFITIILGILLCIALQFSIDIPSVNEPAIVGQILAGLISSFGSNTLHTILAVLTSIKEQHEARTSIMRYSASKQYPDQ